MENHWKNKRDLGLSIVVYFEIIRKIAPYVLCLNYEQKPQANSYSCHSVRIERMLVITNNSRIVSNMENFHINVEHFEAFSIRNMQT